MSITKKLLIENLVNLSLQHLGKLSLKIAESSATKCCFGGGLYEPKFPEELIKLED